MTPEQTNASRWCFAAMSCIVAAWLILKSLCYHNYQYAYDIFSSLDMSRSWLSGHDVLFETRYGQHGRLHNYYSHLLLAPFTATLGAFGLFLAHASLLAFCLYVVLRHSRGMGPDRRFYLAVWVLAFFLGPYGYWIWDDPVFGWHVELLFVPMAVLFGLSLMQDSLWPKLILGGLLVSMREDGCVVACCVHLFWYWAAQMGTGWSGRGLIRMCLIATGWLLVFGAGMWFLAYKNDFEWTRAGLAFSRVREAAWGETAEHLKAQAVDTAAMLAPMALFVLLFFRPRYLIAMLILTTPLLAVSLVASLYTLGSGSTSYGLTWNPRMAMVLGFQFSCMLYMITRGEFSWLLRSAPRRTVYAISCVLLAIIQWRALCDVRQFDATLEQYAAALTSPPSREASILKRLAAAIPRDAYVAVPAFYYAIFEWHRYAWIEYGAPGDAPVKEPDVVIVLETEHLQAVAPALYTKDTCGGLTIWHKPSVQLDLRWCSGGVAPGHAVVLSRTGVIAASAAMTLVDPSGAAADIQGLDPATVGTGGLHGARSVLVADSGEIIAGLGADNRGGTAPEPLHLRRIMLQGDKVAADEVHVTLMMVPPGEAWYVTDIKERAGGGLLAAVSQMGADPASSALVVDQDGKVTLLPAALPPGSLVGIAEAGDRFVCASARGVSPTDIDVVSLPLSPGGLAPFRVHEFTGIAAFGGIEADADGALVLAMSLPTPSSSALVVRLPHELGSTPTRVPGLAGSLRPCAMNPTSGIVAGFRKGTSALVLVETLAAGTTTWSTSIPPDPAAISMRNNPVRYGTASGPSTSYLGSFGGRPVRGNRSFGVRIGGPPGAGAVLLLGMGRGDVATPSGRVLLDPMRPIVPIATVPLASGPTRVPLPIPAELAGATLNLQAVLITNTSPLRVAMTAGLEVTIQ